MPRFIVYELQNQLETHRYRHEIEAEDAAAALAAARNGDTEGEWQGEMGETEYLPQRGFAVLPDAEDTDHHNGWLLALAELQRQEAATSQGIDPDDPRTTGVIDTGPDDEDASSAVAQIRDMIDNYRDLDEHTRRGLALAIRLLRTHVGEEPA